MTIEIVTKSQTAPLEVLDLQVLLRPSSGPSALSLRFLCRDKSHVRPLPMPALSWFDASRLQKFSQDLAASHSSGKCQIDLSEAGLRLTGSVRRLVGSLSAERTIRVEPLPWATSQFTPVTIHISRSDVKLYAQKLYSRLWEVFTRS